LVEVLLLAADIDESVDGACSTQHLAPRLINLAAVQFRLGLRFIHPIVVVVVE